MCLVSKTRHFKPKTADKQILVYKLLRNCSEENGKFLFWTRKKKVILTPFMDIPVKFVHGECEMGDGVMDGEVLCTLPKDFYATLCPCNWEDGAIKPTSTSVESLENGCVYTVYVNKGIHAYIDKDSVFVWQGEEIFNAVIPEGAHYFTNDSNEVVADKMIIFKSKRKFRKIY